MKSILITPLLLFLVAAPVYGLDFQGEISTEARMFLHTPAYDDQTDHNASLAIEMEFRHEFSSASRITVSPFFRVDSSDSNRTDADLRICNYLYVADRWALTIGIDKVFWGVTEFIHLVDIINQTDWIESIDGEEKLGQPMIHLSIDRNWGVIDGFLLPYFRERTFPGKNGRLRGAEVIDDSQTHYESDDNQNHLDIALRYSQTFGNWDLGIYQFYGTSREPYFRYITTNKNTAIPYYELISQTGLDLQFIYNQWLWKLETIYRSGQIDSSGAAAFGFEYTLVGIANSSLDIGIIGEYIYDDRAIAETTLYDNDLMMGLRVNLNDPESTELLLGLIQDMQRDSTILSIELSRRLSDSLKFELSLAVFNNIDKDDPAAPYRDDSFVNILVSYYF